jgi:glycosyltransferase involved in cell wall biosynthesis
MACPEIDDVKERDPNKKIIVTVGRISEEKGQKATIPIALSLKKQNVPYVWFFIGSGELKTDFQKKVIEAGLKDEIYILGNRENPYPYIKNCDVYVQPSEHEGFCLAIAEAVILHKPILANNFDAAKEQIVDGYNGYICSIHSDEFADKLLTLLSDTNISREISANAKKIKSVTDNNMETLVMKINS